LHQFIQSGVSAIDHDPSGKRGLSVIGQSDDLAIEPGKIDDQIGAFCRSQQKIVYCGWLGQKAAIGSNLVKRNERWYVSRTFCKVEKEIEETRVRAIEYT